jgi:hypothetical protein
MGRLFRRERSNPPEQGRCAICGKEHPLATMVTAHKAPEAVPADARGEFPAPRDWWLEDAEAAHEQHPRSFIIPPTHRRRALRAGELVRLGFNFGLHADREGEGHGERMWVEVLEQRADGHAHGRLRNRPSRLAEIEIGDHVAFEPMHVLAIDYSDEELGYAQDQWPVVDRTILAQDRAPDIVIRAPGPYTPELDEWWLLCRAGATGPTIESVGMLTDLFPGLEEPLRAGAGVWEHAGGEHASARWRRVPGHELASSDEWRGLLEWLARTADAMRPDGGSASD